MKGLRKCLTPFAPDQSGAVSVLYELGGILVICDAGGCVGNICGFDEPRWQGRKSAIFSAGLRDMDAIMGRDELLVKKLAAAAKEIDASFAAIIGTPVPAVIGTDYHALTRMAERTLHLPVIAIDTNGMDLYDKGASKAYLELMARFAGTETRAGVLSGAGVQPQEEARLQAVAQTVAQEGMIGILGCCPLEVSDNLAAEKLRDDYLAKGYDRVFVYGMDESLDSIRLSSKVRKHVVISPSGLAAARYMEKKYGIPYECEDILSAAFLRGCDEKWKGKKVLITDQQVAGNSMRKLLQEAGAEVTVSSWFTMDKGLKQPGDVHLKEEDQFEELVRTGNYDCIIADPLLKELTGQWKGSFIAKPQFALSGKA